MPTMVAVAGMANPNWVAVSVCDVTVVLEKNPLVAATVAYESSLAITLAGFDHAVPPELVFAPVNGKEGPLVRVAVKQAVAEFIEPLPFWQIELPVAAGLGFTVTTALNAAPVHAPDNGVTV
jgi:hypothetical protein